MASPDNWDRNIAGQFAAAGIAPKLKSYRLRKIYSDYYGEPVGIDPETGHHMHMDHIVPRYKGGTNDPTNLQPLTRREHILRHQREGMYQECGKMGAEARALKRVAVEPVDIPGYDGK